MGMRKHTIVLNDDELLYVRVALRKNINAEKARVDAGFSLGFIRDNLTELLKRLPKPE